MPRMETPTPHSTPSSLLHRLRQVALVILGVAALGIVFLYLAGPHLVMILLNRTDASAARPVSAEAAALHARLTVVDLHSDVLMWNRDILQRDSRGHTDVPRLIEGNVAVQGFTAATRIPATMNIDATPDRWDVQVPLTLFQGWPAATWTSAKHRALFMARKFEKAAEASNGQLSFLRTREDLARYLERRREDPKITAGFLGIEGLHCLEADLNNVRAMFNAGFRMMAPTHFFDNPLGGSAHGLQKMGLTEFGAEVIKTIEQLQIIVDLAHASPKMIDDILALVTRPVVISHTGVKGTCDNNRNLSDDQLRRIAAGGGLIGIGFWPTATCGEDAASIARAIRYTADLVGVDHVCLGSDYDGATVTPFDAAGMAQLTQALMESGFNEDEISRIMGGNVLRLWAQLLPSEADPTPDVIPQAG